MSLAISDVGSQLQLMFQTKLQTFSGEQLSRALKAENYLMMQGQVNIQNVPQPQVIPVFSKGNVNIFFVAGTNQLFFQLLNTMELGPVMEDVKKLLVPLNIVPDVVSTITVESTVIISTPTEPLTQFTKLVSEKFLTGLASTVGQDFKVAGLVLASDYPLAGDRDGVQIIIEPLQQNPKKQYFLRVLYRTTDMTHFDDFIRRFGRNMLQGIMQEL